MKIRVKHQYDGPENTKIYCSGETIEVIDKDNSDFYHVWNGNNLDLIPKNICDIIKG